MLISEGTEGKDALENAGELISAAAVYDKQTENPSLVDYLQQIALFSDADAYDAASERVAIMTLHSAKGLEFDNVFIVGVEEGLLPHERSAERDRAWPGHARWPRRRCHAPAPRRGAGTSPSTRRPPSSRGRRGSSRRVPPSLVREPPRARRRDRRSTPDSRPRVRRSRAARLGGEAPRDMPARPRRRSADGARRPRRSDSVSRSARCRASGPCRARGRSSCRPHRACRARGGRSRA